MQNSFQTGPFRKKGRKKSTWAWTEILSYVGWLHTSDSAVVQTAWTDFELFFQGLEKLEAPENPKHFNSKKLILATCFNVP